MKREDHQAAMQRLLGMVAPEHQADASTLLTEISEDYDQTLSSLDSATTNVATLTANNEKLREVNTNLFLKVGTPAKQQTTEPTPEADIPSLNYNDLFNERGELK